MPQEAKKEEEKNKIEELITRLARAVQTFRVYLDAHPLSQEAVVSLSSILSELFSQQDEIIVGIIGKEFAYGKEPLYELSEKRKDFINYLKSLEITKIRFARGVYQDELKHFCKILAHPPQALKEKESIQNLFRSYGIQHIAIGEIAFLNEDRIPQAGIERLRDIVLKNYKGNVRLVTQTFQKLKTHRHLDVETARHIVEALIENLLKNKNLLLMLTSMKGRDETEFEHVVHVAIFTLLQAEMFGLERKYLTEMGIAALLYNVGKLTVPDEAFATNPLISEKKSVSDEKKQLQQDVMGAKLLLDTEGINLLSAIVAFEHHIPYDMSGIPRKLYGKELNLASMMIAISEYYDYLRRQPWYYEEGGPEQAYEKMMSLSGKLFHPELLKNFFTVVGIYPPGTLVELDTQEIALVIQSSLFDIRRPQVEILYDSKGERCKEPLIVNLTEKDRRGQYKRTIVRSISPLDEKLYTEDFWEE